MLNRKYDGTAPDLSPELLKQIAESLKPIAKDGVIVYRANERKPMLALDSPARGRFPVHGIRLIGELAAAWGQESRHPQALLANDSAVPGFILFEPVQIWDPRARDQYQISWADGFRRASIDLRPIMQPRNLEVPDGCVREMPISLQQLPTGKTYLFLHTGDSKVRPEREVATEGEQKGRVAEQAAPSNEL